MLRNLQEEDFAVLRGPLESGRQSPGSFSGVFILSIFLQLIMLMLTYVVAADATNFPYIEIIFVVHAFITGILILLSIVYAFPSVYMKGQKTQYLLSILISQNIFGISFYIIALFFVGKERNITVESLLTFTFITLLVGALIFITTGVRFYRLLKRGKYKKETKRDEIRSKIESKVKSHLSMIIVASIGLLLVLQYLVTVFGRNNTEHIMIVLLGISLFYAMLFILPEQLVILYCKYRFDSFNFNKKGNLKPMGRKCS